MKSMLQQKQKDQFLLIETKIDWQGLSSNPNVTCDIVQQNPDGVIWVEIQT